MPSSSSIFAVPFPELLPPVQFQAGAYEARFATTAEEIDQLLRLRFEVFNVELGEGLAASFATQRDEDPFDAQCHHLMVVEKKSGEAVGTYRLQVQEMAQAGRGFYSATEFDFSTWPPSVMAASVELGRASIAKAHRSLPVLYLLWQGIGAYLTHNHRRYLFGCCSLTSQDPCEGADVLAFLEQQGHVHPTLQVLPHPDHACDCVETKPDAKQANVPRLMRVYLKIGAKICGPPALDRAFKTIDYLALFDAEQLDGAMATFFRYRSRSG